MTKTIAMSLAGILKKAPDDNNGIHELWDKHAKEQIEECVRSAYDVRHLMASLMSIIVGGKWDIDKIDATYLKNVISIITSDGKAREYLQEGGSDKDTLYETWVGDLQGNAKAENRRIEQSDAVFDLVRSLPADKFPNLIKNSHMPQIIANEYVTMLSNLTTYFWKGPFVQFISWLYALSKAQAIIIVDRAAWGRDLPPRMAQGEGSATFKNAFDTTKRLLEKGGYLDGEGKVIRANPHCVDWKRLVIRREILSFNNALSEAGIGAVLAYAATVDGFKTKRFLLLALLRQGRRLDDPKQQEKLDKFRVELNRKFGVDVASVLKAGTIPSKHPDFETYMSNVGIVRTELASRPPESERSRRRRRKPREGFNEQKPRTYPLVPYPGFAALFMQIDSKWVINLSARIIEAIDSDKKDLATEYRRTHFPAATTTVGHYIDFNAAALKRPNQGEWKARESSIKTDGVSARVIFQRDKTEREKKANKKRGKMGAFVTEDHRKDKTVELEIASNMKGAELKKSVVIDPGRSDIRMGVFADEKGEYVVPPPKGRQPHLTTAQYYQITGVRGRMRHMKKRRAHPRYKMAVDAMNDKRFNLRGVVYCDTLVEHHAFRMTHMDDLWELYATRKMRRHAFTAFGKKQSGEYQALKIVAPDLRGTTIFMGDANFNATSAGHAASPWTALMDKARRLARLDLRVIRVDEYNSSKTCGAKVAVDSATKQPVKDKDGNPKIVNVPQDLKAGEMAYPCGNILNECGKGWKVRRCTCCVRNYQRDKNAVKNIGARAVEVMVNGRPVPLRLRRPERSGVVRDETEEEERVIDATTSSVRDL